MKKILVYGAYGFDNLGDDLMLECVKRKVISKGYIPVFFKRYAQKFYFEQNYDNWYNFPAFSKFKNKLLTVINIIIWFFFSKVNEFDSIIFMGGGYTNETFGLRNLLQIYLLCLKFKRKKIYFTGQTVGPYNSWLGKFLTKKIYKMGRKVGLRETYSADLLDELGVQYNMIGDDAFLLQKKVSHVKKDIVIFNIKNFKDYSTYFETFSNFLLNYAKLLLSENLKIYIIPFCSDKNSTEYEINYNLYQLLKENKVNCKFFVEKDFDKFVDMFSHAKIVIGSAYHSIVLGSIFNSDVYSFYDGVYYEHKIKGILKWFNYDISRCVKFSELKNINDIPTIPCKLKKNQLNIVDNISNDVNSFWDNILS